MGGCGEIRSDEERKVKIKDRNKRKAKEGIREYRNMIDRRS